MGHFVAQDPFDLLRGQIIHEARRHGDRRVFRIAACRKGVRDLVIDDIDFRHGQAGAFRQALHDAVQGGGAVFIHGTGPVLGQHHLVAVPVGKEIHGDREDEHKHHALAAADIVAHEDEQYRQQGH